MGMRKFILILSVIFPLIISAQSPMYKLLTKKSAVIPGYFIDSFSTATVAYSVRKLSSAATNSIRVRRSSDNTEQDIGFVSNMIDTASLKTFVGANDGFVTTWYDQSGNGNNAIQTTYVNQPYIILSGSISYTNGLPTINFGTQSNHYGLTLPTGILNGATSLSYFQVAKITDYGSSNSGVFAPSSTNSTGLEILQVGVISYYSYLRVNGTQRDANTGAGYRLWNNATQSLTDLIGNATNLTANKNAASVSLTDASALPALSFNGIYAIGYYSDIAYYTMYGDMQELIIYTVDKTTKRTAMEANINFSFTIY